MKKDQTTHLLDEAFARINQSVGQELNDIVNIIESQVKKKMESKPQKNIRFIRTRAQKAFA